MYYYYILYYCRPNQIQQYLIFWNQLHHISSTINPHIARYHHRQRHKRKYFLPRHIPAHSIRIVILIIRY
jgi:hypothetical protein